MISRSQQVRASRMMLRGGRRRPGESKNSVRGVGPWLRHFGTVQKDFVASGLNQTRLSTRRQCLLLFFLPSHVCSSVRTRLDYRSPGYSRECLALQDSELVSRLRFPQALEVVPILLYVPVHFSRITEDTSTVSCHLCRSPRGYDWITGSL